MYKLNGRLQFFFSTCRSNEVISWLESTLQAVLFSIFITESPESHSHGIQLLRWDFFSNCFLTQIFLTTKRIGLF